MKADVQQAASIAGLIFLLFSSAPRSGADEPNQTTRIQKASAAFDVGTNISAISIHGVSNALQAKVRIRHNREELVLEEVEARLPVNTLSTGMGLRDEHMRKYIFTTQDGRMPDLRFTASNVTCPTADGREVQCAVPGMLEIRGIERPFTLPLKLRQESGVAPAFRGSGEGVMRLSDYGIERPSQFGVRANDEVKLRVEVAGKELSFATGTGERP
jgi:polyisoprenoid-binding protein YceI